MTDKAEVHRFYTKIQNKLSNEERKSAHKIIRHTLEEIEKEKREWEVDSMWWQDR